MADVGTDQLAATVPLPHLGVPPPREKRGDRGKGGEGGVGGGTEAIAPPVFDGELSYIRARHGEVLPAEAAGGERGLNPALGN